MLDMIKIMYTPKDGSSLAVLRILFGLLMMVDIIQERGGLKIGLIWGDSNDCHFPLFPFVKQLELDYMCIIYGSMWMCAVFISLGFCFKTSCALFSLSYWYLILLDKSYWNNHSYLYGLLAILLMSSSANSCWSLDAFLKPQDNSWVPSWNYFIMRFQLFILYFYAGLKKTDLEWFDGYSMQHLGSHWIFGPFKYVFTLEQVDYFVIHVSGFLIDISSGFLLLFSCTRPFGLAINASFHLINTRLFNIGMFPYMCLGTLPIFCNENWPRNILNHFSKRNPSKLDNYHSMCCKIPKKSKVTIVFITLYCFLQLILPWSHFITKGYNNWTQGLYGYSWDMMVHRWDSALTVVKVIDHNNHAEYHLDPKVWTINDRWSKHADMCLQYAQCVRRNINMDKNRKTSDFAIKSVNISIYIDVWCSLNGRFQQRMFDPNYDLLTAIWSPFQDVEWLKPLLTDHNDWRLKIAEIEAEVHSWSNYSDVMIIADFPGLHFDNYISSDLSNVTLTVLDGEVYFEMPDSMFGLHLKAGQVKGNIPTDSFHRITTVSATPSCFMYSFFNRTKINIESVPPNNVWASPFQNGGALFADFKVFIKTVGTSLFNILFRVSNCLRA